MRLIFWLLEPIFFYFLRQQSTAVSGRSSLFNLEMLLWLGETSFFSTGDSIVLFRVFSANGNYY